LKTKILNLKGVQYEGEARLLNAQTQSGEITILPKHQPIITVLKKDSRIYLDNESGQRQNFKIKSGFLHLDAHENLTVLVD